MNESEAWFNVLLKSGKQQAVANFKGSLFYSVLEMLHDCSLNCPVPCKLLALKMSVCVCEWKMSENWPDVVGGVNLVGVNCTLLTSSLGLHQCLIGCGGLCVNILEGFFCLWSRLQPLCSNVNSVLIAQNVCLNRVTQHAAKCWKNVRESLVIFFLEIFCLGVLLIGVWVRKTFELWLHWMHQNYLTGCRNVFIRYCTGSI